MVRSWKGTVGSSDTGVRAVEKDNTQVCTMGQRDQNELAEGKRQEGGSTGKRIDVIMVWKNGHNKFNLPNTKDSAEPQSQVM